MNLTLKRIIESVEAPFLNKVETKGDKIVLHHYGDDGGKGYLDPSKFGINPYTLATQKAWDKPRVFFYISPSDRERMVSGNHYIAHYPLSKLYYFNRDPNDYYDGCLEDFIKHIPRATSLPLRQQLSCISKKAEEDGYGGMILDWSDTYRVDIWERVPVKLATT